MNDLMELHVPVILVAPVVLGLVGAIKWLVAKNDKLVERLINAKADQRQTAISLREALRERDPGLGPLSFSDDSDLFDLEHRKDLAAVLGRLSPRQERRLERYAKTGDPSTPPDPIDPPRKKMPSRS